MTIDEDRTVGELAIEYPPATRVFARHGIDYCCGGRKPLRDICEAEALDTALVLEEIRQEVAGAGGMVRRWDELPLEALIDHIISTYHRSLNAELPRLGAMAHTVYEAHRDKAEAMLSEVLSTYEVLTDELEQHMAKEEQILFPMIKRGQGNMAVDPISCMEHEHESVGSALARLRAFTNDYAVPAEACATWKALWHGLEELESSLHEHIHLENHILFPRALASRS